MDQKRQKLSPEKNDVPKECRDAKITDLERKLVLLENKLKLVTAELEQVKEEHAFDKIHFETENCELKSEIEKYKEQCTELQSENEKLQKYLQDLESTKINVEEKSQINFYNTDLTQQVTKVTAELEQLKEEQARNKLNFEIEKWELESKIDRYKEQCTELQMENERLQKYLQDLQSANIVEENSQINLYNTGLTSQITKIGENLRSDRSSTPCTDGSNSDDNNSDDNMVVENASKLYPVEDKIMDSYLLPTCYSNTDIKVILCHYIKDKEIEVDLVYVDYSSDFTICEQWEEHHKSFIKKIEQDLNLNPFQEFEKFYVFGDREINFINASFIVWLSQQKNNVKILLVPIFGCIYLLDFYEIMENTLKNKNINIELKEDDCYAIRSEYGIDMPKFVEVVRLKIDNIDSYVSEKIPQIIKSCNNYSIIHRNILLGQCSESCKVEDGKDGCEVEQLCEDGGEDGDLPFWLRF